MAAASLRSGSLGLLTHYRGEYRTFLVVLTTLAVEACIDEAGLQEMVLHAMLVAGFVLLIVRVRHHVLRIPDRLDEEVPLPGREVLLEHGLHEEVADVVDHLRQRCVVLAGRGQGALRAAAVRQKHVALHVNCRVLELEEPLLLELAPDLQLRVVRDVLPLVQHLDLPVVLFSPLHVLLLGLGLLSV